MLLIRVIAFTLAVLLLTETISTSWYWYLALWVFCLASFSIVSFAASFVSFWLMVGVFHPSDAWHTVLAVFTIVAVVQALLRRSRSQTQIWTSGWEFGRGRRARM